MPSHGGDLSSATERFAIAEADWLDLSTGISPHPYPHTEFDAALLHRLPTTGDGAPALAAARHFYGVPDGAAIIAVPGTQAALQALPTLHRLARIAILGPTYSEHGHTWRDAGHGVSEVSELNGLADADVAVLVNPNNPDGNRIAPGDIAALAEARGGKWTIVDEAFCDAEPGLSVAGKTGGDGLLMLRSLGKFFGLAGLRVGFVIGAPDVIAAIEARLGPWSVGAAALAITARALSDTDWINAARVTLSESRAEMEKLLSDAGFTILGGTDLFILAEHGNAAGIYEQLGHAGILIRTFDDHPTWLRFGLAGHSNMARLKAALSAPDPTGG
jgi:cobalamin biosynthetic protein CobC